MNRLTDALLQALLPYRTRVAWSLVNRPQYAYCMWHAATLARRLGHKRISVIEFGVAGGNGLVAIEKHAAKIQSALSVDFEIYGFDSGAGLPPPCDYRDLPYHWKAGFFKMDPDGLMRRLRSAKVVLGDVRETAGGFFEKYQPAPIGCVFHDLDFYSSTRDSFQLLDGPQTSFLPRVYNYFDDIIGTEVELYNDFTGQRLAVAEFNAKNDKRKLARCYHFERRRVRRLWHEQIMILHDFAHPHYNSFISDENQQLPLG